VAVQRHRSLTVAALLAPCLLPALAFGQGSSTRLVYAITGRPAAAVVVDVFDASGKARHATTDRSGRLAGLDSASRILVKHAGSGTILADRAFADRVPAEIMVGLPVRVSGEVSGFGDDPARIEVDCAYGERLPISDYQRQVHGTGRFAMPDENTVHGLDLPPVPEHSLRTHPDASGRFTTGWFAAYDDPEVLAFRQGEGATGVKTVTISKSAQAGTTVSAGKITPNFGATLEIQAALSNNDAPRGLVVEVASIETAPAARDQLAVYLSALHRRDAALSRFLLKRGDLPVSLNGSTRIAGVPPAEILKLRFHGPDPGFEIERTVQVPGQGIVRIDLSQPMLRAAQATATFSGTVRLSTGAAVPGALVVLTSYPKQYETKTGADGLFQIEGVVTGQRGKVRIEGSVAGAQPPFDRFVIDREVDPVPAGGSSDNIYEITVPRGRGLSFGAKTLSAPAPQPGLLGQQGPPLEYKFSNCFYYTQDDFQFVSVPVMTAYKITDTGQLGDIAQIAGEGVVDAEKATAIFNAQFKEAGKYAVFLEFTPFVYDAVAINVQTPNQRLEFMPKRLMEAIQIRVTDKNGGTAKGVQIQFPGWSAEPDPYTVETDGNGNVNINCVSLGPPKFTGFDFINVFVDDANSGYFNGTLSLPGQEGVLKLKLVKKPTLDAKK
jgi:hypothetical protein